MPELPAYCGGWPLVAMVPPPPDREKQQLQTLREAVDELEQDTSVVWVVCEGAVGPALAREASRNGCDAIVIGAPSSRWTRLTGGVARYLERHSGIEVIVVPARDATAPAGNVSSVLGAGARVRAA